MRLNKKAAHYFLLKLTVLGLLSLGTLNSFAQEAYQPASISDAQAVFDLSEKPIIEPASNLMMTIAQQNLETPGSVGEVGKRIDQELTKRGLKQQPNPFSDANIFMATYEKSGFYFSLNVEARENGKSSSVFIQNLGKVDFRKLPKINDCNEVYVGGNTAVYFSNSPPNDIKKRFRELLEAEGWEWFGETEVSFYMRKNAVTLHIMTSEIEQPGAKSSLTISSSLISSTLPIIKGLTQVSYDELQLTLRGDSPLELTAFFKKYRELLESNGWKATTENPLDNRLGAFLIFVNTAGESLELSALSFEGKSRFELEFKTVARVKEDNERADKAKAEMEAAAAKKSNPVIIEISPPEDGKIEKQSDNLIEFSVKPGKAYEAIKKELQKWEADGWKTETRLDQKNVSDFRLTKGDSNLTISHFDSGVFEGKITFQTKSGFKLKLKE